MTFCKTIKAETEEQKVYSILLTKDMSGTYIIEKYKEYNASDVKRNSRSQNRYTATFTTFLKQFEDLETTMSEDEKVIEFTESSIRKIDIQSSKNVKKN